MAESPHSNRVGVGTLLKTRVPPEMKLRLAALAKKRGVNKSTLVRQLIARALGESSSVDDMNTASQQTPGHTPRRLTVRVNAADRRALRARAKNRNVTASRYLAALVRAHLKNDIRPMAAEMAAMRELTIELNAIGVGLNHLARAANEGAVWAGPLKEILEQLLAEFEMLGVRLAAFGQASRETLQSNVADEDLRSDSESK